MAFSQLAGLSQSANVTAGAARDAGTVSSTTAAGTAAGAAAAGATGSISNVLQNVTGAVTAGRLLSTGLFGQGTSTLLPAASLAAAGSSFTLPLSQAAWGPARGAASRKVSKQLPAYLFFAEHGQTAVITMS